MSKIINSKVTIRVATDSGYMSQETIDNSPLSPGSSPLMQALSEIVRLLAINGEEKQIRARVEDAIAAVNADDEDDEGEL